MEIKKIVKKLKEEYGTNCPFKLCKYLGINIMYLELGEIKGFFKSIGELKYIVINDSLSEFDSKFVCAHELGHSLLHDKDEMKFLLEHAKIIKHSKYEKEANLFAGLLLKDDEINEYVNESLISFEFLNNLKTEL